MGAGIQLGSRGFRALELLKVLILVRAVSELAVFPTGSCTRDVTSGEHEVRVALGEAMRAA
jgi:3-hydroxybenzoate 6-monooxygenase